MRRLEIQALLETDSEMDAGTHRYSNTLSDEFDGALKVMKMKDEAIVLTTAVIRLLPPGTNTTNWHARQLHHEEMHFRQCCLLRLLSKASLPSINWTNISKGILQLC